LKTENQEVKKPRDRNIKRGRISSLIRERKEKRKLLELNNLSSTVSSDSAEDLEAVKTLASERLALETTPHVILTPADPRYHVSKILMDSMNTCDIALLGKAFRKHCVPEVICSVLYTGKLEHNPLGPNSRVYIGVDILTGLFVC
jgi:elongation factor P--beta-lysine ligase